mgnify:CR=1 FL=1
MNYKMSFDLILENVFGNKFLISFIVIVGALFLRWILIKHLRELKSDDKELPRRWINSTKNTFNLIIAVGLFTIWLSELQFVALSIATFIVALVIAAREFIQCFIGSMFHTSTRSFTIGDWVKIGGNYGEVVNNNWLTTTLMELDIESQNYNFTGKTIAIPNHLLITSPISNLNFMRHFVTHSFSIVREPANINPCEARTIILKKAEHYCASFFDTAKQFNEKLERSLGIELAGPEAEVRISTSNIGKNIITISIFCPTEQAVRIEQKLTDDVLNHWYSKEKSALEETYECQKVE